MADIEDKEPVTADEAFGRVLSAFAESAGKMTSEEEVRLTEAEAGRLRGRREQNFIGSGVPRKYLGVELSEIRSSGLSLCAKDFSGKAVDLYAEADSFIADVVSGVSRALWLCGNSGTGKTTFALAIMRELCRAGVSAAYFKSHRVMQSFEETKYFSSRGRRACDVMDDVCRPRFRVFDEIGRYPVAQWEKFRLFDISNEVYEAGGSSIYISNLSRDELAMFLGAASVDRFRGSSMTLEFDGRSLRGRSGELYTKFGWADMGAAGAA
ncbi:MAG: ATP-binding protein [Treponema sp.]|nr:ATP-binding protein [Treponema sp.]MBQ7167319.1 ATP-binding protein [Treponema sp.]